jgi:hypothetical protein
VTIRPDATAESRPASAITDPAVCRSQWNVNPSKTEQRTPWCLAIVSSSSVDRLQRDIAPLAECRDECYGTGNYHRKASLALSQILLIVPS